MYYFIHGKLVKDGSLPGIVQPNNYNFVLLVIEQSPDPGEENSHPRAAEPSSRPGSGCGAEGRAGTSASAPAPAARPLPGTRGEAAAQAA